MSDEGANSSHPENQSDELFSRWVLSGREHSDSILGPLLDSYRPYLLRIANDEIGDIVAGNIAPSDLVQEALAKAFEKIDLFRGSTSEEFRGWLRRIFRNLNVDATRHYSAIKFDNQRPQPLPLDLAGSSGLSPSRQALSQEEWDRLQAGLAQLTEQHREVIFLRNRDNLSFPEIGQRLGKSSEAARKLWGRAIIQLQELLNLDESSNFFPPTSAVS